VSQRQARTFEARNGARHDTQGGKDRGAAVRIGSHRATDPNRSVCSLSRGLCALSLCSVPAPCRAAPWPLSPPPCASFRATRTERHLHTATQQATQQAHTMADTVGTPSTPAVVKFHLAPDTEGPSARHPNPQAPIIVRTRAEATKHSALTPFASANACDVCSFCVCV
jgi:hypothetical protein